MIKVETQKTLSKSREKQTRYLSQAIQLEEAVNPHIIRATMTMVSVAILIFLVWAAFTNINEVARTPGEIIPQGYQQSVQHLEGGIVSAIHVRDGNVVEKGDILVSLSGSGVRDDLSRAKSRHLSFEMQEERLRAFVEGREPDFSPFPVSNERIIADQKSFFDDMRTARAREEAIIKEQIAEKGYTLSRLQSELSTQRENERITNEVYTRRKQLNDKGYASDMVDSFIISKTIFFVSSPFTTIVPNKTCKTSNCL